MSKDRDCKYYDGQYDNSEITNDPIQEDSFDWDDGKKYTQEGHLIKGKYKYEQHWLADEDLF